MVTWLVVAGVLAVGDWIAVALRITRLEYVCKPATMLALVGVAATVDTADDAARAWFIAAVLLSMLGDVFLMLPSDRFVPGLASFLLAHVAYTIGLSAFDLWALVLVVAVSALLAVRILRAADRDLRGPVAAYIVVIAAMVTSALSSGDAMAIAGASLFYASDATIAWNRFVKPLRWAPLFIIVTYHLGQAGLVMSLAD